MQGQRGWSVGVYVRLTIFVARPQLFRYEENRVCPAV